MRASFRHFQTLTHKILDLGSAPGIPVATAKKVHLANQLAIFLFALSMCFTVLHIVLGETYLTPLDLALSAVWFSIPVLNHYGYINASRLLVITYFNALLFVLSCLLGREQHVHFGMYTLAVMGLVLFESKNRIAIAYSLILPITLFLLLEISDFTILNSMPGFKKINGGPSIFNDLAGFASTFAVVFYFFRSFHALFNKLEATQSGLEEAQRLARIGSWDWKISTNSFSVSEELSSVLFASGKAKSLDFRTFLRTLSKSDRTAVAAAFRRLRTNSVSEQLEVTSNYETKGRRTVFMQGRAIRNDGGDLDRIHGTVQDVTELRDAQKTILNQQAKMIEASKMSSLGEMAGGIAHEINTPLAVIQLNAKQMRRMTLADTVTIEKIGQKSETIEGMATLIAKIIKGLQTFARNADEDPFEPFAVRSIVEETLVLSASRFEYHGIKLRVPEIPPGLMIEGRGTQLGQVLLNLLNNAFDAASQHEEKWVEIGFSDEDNWLKIDRKSVV